MKLVAEQQSTGGCWNPSKKKDMPLPRKRRRGNKMGRRGAIMLKSNPIDCQRLLAGTSKPCTYQDPGKEAMI